MPVHYYQNCRCPDCRHKLDKVATTAPVCPQCNKPLDSPRVWSTRTYHGTLILPGWLPAFGWPLLLILAGVSLGALTHFMLGIIYIKACSIIIATGLVWFFVKLVGADDV